MACHILKQPITDTQSLPVNITVLIFFSFLIHYLGIDQTGVFLAAMHYDGVRYKFFVTMFCLVYKEMKLMNI